MVRKSGYTLLEAAVVMLIVSIFIAVIATVIPHKVKPKTESDAHGHFECYYSGNRLVQRTFAEGNNDPEIVDRTSQGFCEFVPPKYLRFLIINAVGGGSGTGNAGKFVSTFYNSALSASYKIYIGQGAADNGSDTHVNNAEDDEIIRVGGGIDLTDIRNTSVENIIGCTVTGLQHDDNRPFNDDYICDKGPICEVSNDKIQVSYCRTNELYRTVYLPYQRRSVSSGSDDYVEASETNFRNTQVIVESPYTSWDYANGILTYCDTSLWDDWGRDPDAAWTVNTSTCTSNNEIVPSLYKMQIRIDTSREAAESQMTKYIKMLQYDASDAITTIEPGNGKSSGKGNDGAVLIIW